MLSVHRRPLPSPSSQRNGAWQASCQAATSIGRIAVMSLATAGTSPVSSWPSPLLSSEWGRRLAWLGPPFLLDAAVLVAIEIGHDVSDR